MEHPFMSLSCRPIWKVEMVSIAMLRSTTPVATLIAYGDNASKCFGVVGSGNRNFNNQYLPDSQAV